MGWQTKELVEVTELITCGVAKRPDYVDEGIPFLSAKNVKNGEVIWENYKFVSEETHRILTKHNKPSKGDILYTRVGSFGEAAIINRDDEFSIFVSLTLIKPKHETLNNGYLKYYLNSESVKQKARASINGVGVGNLNVGTVRKFPIPLPPITEQQRIVAILDQAFADIEKARANAEKNLKNARELFDSYLNQVFSQRGEENQDVMRGWKTDKLFNLGVTQTGSTPKTTVKENFGSAIPFVKPADFQPNGLIDYNNDGLSQKGLAESRLVKKGSVLMVCIGATIGKVGYTSVNVTTNQQINSFTPHQGMLTKYCYYAMLNNEFHRQVIYNSSQATLPIINKSKWSSLEIKYPSSILEQQRIIDSLDNLSDKVQQLEKGYQEKLTSLDELKKSLLQKAFSGELTKTEGHAA